MNAVFLDRDGTITYGTPRYERVDSLDKVELLPDTLEALTLLATLDYGVFIVTNQAGLSEGLITRAQFDAINDKVLELIEPTRIVILDTYVCPHGVAEVCDCKKPLPKLLFDAAAQYDIDLDTSWMIGDRPTDVMCGVNAGAKGILVKTGVPTVECDEAIYTGNSLLDAVNYIANA